ncbi:MAG: hypothetical protein GXZ15_01860 [Campylobacter sp.]|nr:hypothetical protein [Campylobacter sp.]
MLKIGFDRVKGSDFPFEIEQNSLKFSGILYKKSLDLVKCEGKISGKLEHICDRCGDDMTIELDEDIDILLSNGVYKSENLEDVMEFFDSIVIDEILESEVESFKAGYLYCKKCKNL